MMILRFWAMSCIPLFKYKFTGEDQVSQEEITFGFGVENLVTLSHPVGSHIGQYSSEFWSYFTLRQCNVWHIYI